MSGPLASMEKTPLLCTCCCAGRWWWDKGDQRSQTSGVRDRHIYNGACMYAYTYVQGGDRLGHAGGGVHAREVPQLDARVVAGCRFVRLVVGVEVFGEGGSRSIYHPSVAIVVVAAAPHACVKRHAHERTRDKERGRGGGGGGRGEEADVGDPPCNSIVVFVVGLLVSDGRWRLRRGMWFVGCTQGPVRAPTTNFFPYLRAPDTRAAVPAPRCPRRHHPHPPRPPSFPPLLPPPWPPPC